MYLAFFNTKSLILQTVVSILFCLLYNNEKFACNEKERIMVQKSNLINDASTEVQPYKTNNVKLPSANAFYNESDHFNFKATH